MGSIEDIDDTPIETPISKDAEDFLAEVEMLIDEEHVQYARDFLEDVAESVRNSGRVTEAQWQAVRNIDDGGLRNRRRDRW